MRLSRNRNWGHPDLVHFLERLSTRAAKTGTWPGLLVGDMSQPRGGPMLTGHASHQVGLDADIWLTPAPGRQLSLNEREDMSATMMVREDRLDIDPRVFTPGHLVVIRAAAKESASAGFAKESKEDAPDAPLGLPGAVPPGREPVAPSDRPELARVDAELLDQLELAAAGRMVLVEVFLVHGRDVLGRFVGQRQERDPASRRGGRRVGPPVRIVVGEPRDSVLRLSGNGHGKDWPGWR